MNTLQIKKLKMYIALRILLRDNPNILAKLPNGNELLTALDTVIADLQANNLRQQESDRELREQLEVLRENLKQDILSTSRKMQAYADFKKSNALMKDVKFTKTDLSNLKDIELVQIAKSLHEKVNQYLTELGNYGLNADTQKTLLDSATLYETSSPKLDVKEREQTHLTTTITENFKTADGIVASLDKQVEIILDTEPVFYKEYKATRKVEIPTDVVQLIIRVTDAETGAGIPNATVTLTLNGSTAAPIMKQTAGKGGFQIKTITSGIYTVTVVKLGYQTQTLSIIITGDEPYNLDVKMVKG